MEEGTKRPTVTLRSQQPKTAFTKLGGKSDDHEGSQIWRNAIQRYYDELEKGGIKGPAIEKDLWNVESAMDLLEQMKTLEPQDWKSMDANKNLINRLEPVLLSLSDFAAVTACAFGMNGKAVVAAVVWGSIRLLLKVSKPMLPDVLDMLEHLRQVLPRYRKYEQELPMTDTLENLLSDMYTEIIIFCARAITVFRNNPTIGTKHRIWSVFRSEFSNTMDSLRTYSTQIDREVEMIRLTREKNSAETIAMMQKLNDAQSVESKYLPCRVVPYGLNPRFCNRTDEIEKLRGILDPGKDMSMLRIMAVYGLGGVGKTQLALHYANISQQIYDVVAWIPCETQINLTQALSSLAQKLGLSNSDESGESSQSIVKVRDWLNKTKHRFLLVFDNVEQIDILQQIWPARGNGSILITTRSLSVASKRAADVLHLQPFEPDTGLDALYSLASMKPTTEAATAAAEEIFRLLGGLPLALIQISDFIRERGFSYEQFLRLYRSSEAKVYAKLKRDTPIDYNESISTVWELQMERLSEESKTLQSLITFFDPDSIAEAILTNPKAGLTDERLEFLTDEFEFSEAVSELLKASLINRSAEHQTLSVHRLVQAIVFSRLSKEERIFFMDSSIILLSRSFPNTWRKTGDQQGHGWAAWEKCSTVLAHVGWLIELTKKHKLHPTRPDHFAELIFRAGTYLWEREQPTTARGFFGFGLSLEIDPNDAIFFSANRLLGHIALDLAQPRAALKAYNETLTAALRTTKPDDPAIAAIYDSIACSYTEMADVQNAFKYLEMASKIHHAHDPNRMARTYAIYAMTYLRAEKPTEALEALNHCWKLQNLSQDEIAASRYPKHSGDIVLLSRILYGLGKKNDALELASKSITIRKGILGHKGPRVADSMYLVAGMLKDEGKKSLAAQLLREIIEMGQGMTEMSGHLARAMWTLSKQEDEAGNHNEAETLRENARKVREGIAGREVPDDDSDEGFIGLVGYMLW